MQVDSMVTCDVCSTNDFLTDGDPPDDWDCTEEHDLCPACMEGVKQGIAALREGRTISWEEVRDRL